MTCMDGIIAIHSHKNQLNKMIMEKRNNGFENLHEWSERMQGAREMLLAIIDSVNASKGRFLLDSAGKDSKVYHDAIVRLIL